MLCGLLVLVAGAIPKERLPVFALDNQLVGLSRIGGSCHWGSRRKVRS